jgi:hypothetical protein
MILTDEDLIVINAAVAKGGDVWNCSTLENIKTRIKSHFRNGDEGHCCYCRRRFKGEFKLDIDIEHVLPKSKFRDFIFEIFNLNISCKRCNMLIKKERTDFLVDVANIHLNPRSSEQYLIIHPNFDNYFDNMLHYVVICNHEEMVMFIPKQDKGQFTHDFFRLTEIQIDTFNKAQGIGEIDADLALASLPQDLQPAAKSLINQL